MYFICFLSYQLKNQPYPSSSSYNIKPIQNNFKLGEQINDYKTTNNSTYTFDPSKAIEAKGVLKDELKLDLRSSHYKLGYDMGFNNKTTHQSTYIPYNMMNSSKADCSEELRKNHFDFNPNSMSQNNRTIYMTDYTKKEIEIDN